MLSIGYKQCLVGCGPWTRGPLITILFGFLPPLQPQNIPGYSHFSFLRFLARLAWRGLGLGLDWLRLACLTCFLVRLASP